MRKNYYKYLLTVLSLILLPCTFIYAQYNGKNFSIGINAVYTTTARIYPYPNSSDVILRNVTFPLSDIFNPAVEIRYRLSDEVLLGFNTGYMSKTAEGNNLTVFSGNRTVAIKVQDGFKLIPFELSCYYILPFSTERFKFLMGGGGAYYYGKQIRNFGNAAVISRETKIAYGIQVSVSMDYLITPVLAFHAAMKFRDPQFTVNNTYTRQKVTYNGSVYELAQQSFTSKVNVDGVTFLMGFAYSF